MGAAIAVAMKRSADNAASHQSSVSWACIHSIMCNAPEPVPRLCGWVTATGGLLDGRTLDAAERTEDTAIPCLRPEQLSATGALVKVDARVDRHLFFSGGPTFRAGDYRSRQNFHGTLK